MDADGKHLSETLYYVGFRNVNMNSTHPGGITLGSGLAEDSDQLLQGFHVLVGQDGVTISHFCESVPAIDTSFWNLSSLPSAIQALQVQ